ncbi:hypothetical protein CPC08DRAFT_713120 [Agrocybe pediades]|nr:hypothetical protein CPC08DRAFT_713120 [Agrocybe pediades]
MFSGVKVKRAVLFPLIGLTAFFSILFLFRVGQRDVPETEPSEFDELSLDFLDYPPTYRDLREAEWNLPQHNLDLPFPEGRNGRFVKFSCEIGYLGFNNVLNERLMNSFLAYKSNRAYVFTEYTWKPDYYPWPEERRLVWPLSTPMSALIAGPTVGGAWPANDTAPRAISSRWWDVVCPPERRRIMFTREVKTKPGVWDGLGSDIFAAWQKALLEAEEPCIEIVSVDRSEDDYPQVFDLRMFGTWKVLSLWDLFANGPVSQLLKTSPIVERGVVTNHDLFALSPDDVDPYSRMLAIHLRRGDYKQACTSLSDWNSTYYSWNLHDFLPDHFDPPPGGTMGKNTPENEAKYMVHCLPTDEQILQKIRDSKEDYIKAVEAAGDGKATVDVLYILTNDKSNWLDEVKKTMKRNGWKKVVTSGDLKLDRETKEVNMAVDMDIARRAAVFIGNGWSSFTSNIVHRRLVDGKIPMSIRFY